MHSCIYQGRVTHRRKAPTTHAFSYSIFMMYLDLDELPTLFKPFALWSAKTPNIAWFRRADHLQGKANLKQTVLDLVEAETAYRPTGRVCLLTHLRYFGYGFNPASFYYCYDAQSAVLKAIVVEVNNTPWGDRHAYVLDVNTQHSAAGQPYRFVREKVFHVSPFMPMDIEYTWIMNEPGQNLDIRIENRRQGRKFFDANLMLKKRSINAKSLRAVLIFFPFMTFKVIGAIYYQALRLWLKKVPFYPRTPQQIDSRKEI